MVLSPQPSSSGPLPSSAAKPSPRPPSATLTLPSPAPTSPSAAAKAAIEAPLDPPPTNAILSKDPPPRTRTRLSRTKSVELELEESPTHHRPPRNGDLVAEWAADAENALDSVLASSAASEAPPNQRPAKRSHGSLDPAPLRPLETAPPTTREFISPGHKRRRIRTAVAAVAAAAAKREAAAAAAAEAAAAASSSDASSPPADPSSDSAIAPPVPAASTVAPRPPPRATSSSPMRPDPRSDSVVSEVFSSSDLGFAIDAHADWDSPPPHSPGSPFERLSLALHRRIAHYLPRPSWLAALARTSRTVFAHVAPVLWADPWDMLAYPADAGIRAHTVAFDEKITSYLTPVPPPELEAGGEGEVPPPARDYARMVHTIPSTALGSGWVMRAGTAAATRDEDAGRGLTVHFGLEVTTNRIFSRVVVPLAQSHDPNAERPPGVHGDPVRVTGLVADVTAEKYRRRYIPAFWTILTTEFPHVTRLDVLGAEVVLEPMAATLRNDPDSHLHRLQHLALTFHVTGVRGMEFLAEILRHLPDLRSLSLTFLNSARAADLAPLASAGHWLPRLRRLHVTPSDDARSPNHDVAHWLWTFLASFSPATYRAVELIPLSEYSITRYFRSYYASVDALPAPPKIDRLTLWLPPQHDTLMAHAAPLLAALAASVTWLDLSLYSQHPRANRGGFPPALALRGTDAPAAALFARVPGGAAWDATLAAVLAHAAPRVRTLTLPPLVIGPELDALRGLAGMPCLHHFSFALAPPFMAAGPGNPGPGMPDQAATARLARIVARYGAYSYVSSIACDVIAHSAGVRSAAWMTLPLTAGEPLVFDGFQREFMRATVAPESEGVAGKAGAKRRSILADMGLVMRYEERADGAWAVCNVGVHAAAFMRRAVREATAGPPNEFGMQ
ncbi:hypothetical protein H9P43_006488 [Blastocladiella emersonii ATCC 22665]|nr:hypothetical protein H9P43_006488 [Blastocladiella emersonii ATCC 22665]